MESAWPEPPPAMYAEPSAGVRHIVKAFAFITTETLPNLEEQSGARHLSLGKSGLGLAVSRAAVQLPLAPPRPCPTPALQIGEKQ